MNVYPAPRARESTAAKPQRHLPRGAATAALCLSAMGCVPQSGVGRATTLEPGKHQLTVALEPAVVTPKFSATKDVSLPYVLPVLSYHRGLNERLEMGIRIWGIHTANFLDSYGGALDTKVQFYRSKSWHIAAAGAAGYHTLVLGGAHWHVGHLTLPFLLGANLGDHQFVFGPRLALGVLGAYGMNPVATYWGGLSVGFAWRVGRLVQLFPEVVWLYSPVRFGGEDTTSKERGVNLLTVGLGVAVDLP